MARHVSVLFPRKRNSQRKLAAGKGRTQVRGSPGGTQVLSMKERALISIKTAEGRNTKKIAYTLAIRTELVSAEK
jgi:hypothetical protein